MSRGFSCLGLYKRHLNYVRDHGRVVFRFPFCVRCGKAPPWADPLRR